MLVARNYQPSHTAGLLPASARPPNKPREISSKAAWPVSAGARCNGSAHCRRDGVDAEGTEQEEAIVRTPQPAQEAPGNLGPISPSPIRESSSPRGQEREEWPG